MDKKYTKKQVIKWAIECDVYLNVKKAMKHYGVEGTEDVIKRVYSSMPKLREAMLKAYKEIINGQEMPPMP